MRTAPADRTAPAPTSSVAARGAASAKIHAISYQTGPVRRLINSYKYRGGRDLAVVLGRLLLAWLEQHMATSPPGLIVANPSFVGPDAQQFAHTEAVLTAAAAACPGDRWPFDPAAIVKTRPTLKSADGQAWSKRVSGNELRDALLIPDPARTARQFVLIYDDVCTTGTQLDAVAGCLLDQGGAARVEAVVLARAPWRGSGVAGTGNQPLLRPLSNASAAAGRGYQYVPSPADFDARSK